MTLDCLSDRLQGVPSSSPAPFSLWQLMAFRDTLILSPLFSYEVEMEGCSSGRGVLPHTTASGLHFICSACFLASCPGRASATNHTHSRHYFARDGVLSYQQPCTRRVPSEGSANQVMSDLTWSCATNSRAQFRTHPLSIQPSRSTAVAAIGLAISQLTAGPNASAHTCSRPKGPPLMIPWQLCSFPLMRHVFFDTTRILPHGTNLGRSKATASYITQLPASVTCSVLRKYVVPL